MVRKLRVAKARFEEQKRAKELKEEARKNRLKGRHRR